MSAGSQDQSASNAGGDGGIEAYRQMMRENFEKREAEERLKRVLEEEKQYEDLKAHEGSKQEELSATDEEVARALQEEFEREESCRMREETEPPIIPPDDVNQDDLEGVRSPDQVYSERLIGFPVSSEAAQLEQALQESAAEAGVTPSPPQQFIDVDEEDTDDDGNQDRRLAVKLQRQEWAQG